MLEKMKLDNDQMTFSYLFDTNLKEREMLDPKNPQIEILFV